MHQISRQHNPPDGWPPANPSSHRLAWVASDTDANPVGSAYLRLFTKPGQAHPAELELTVHPTERRKGVGSQLLDAAVGVARDRKVRTVTTDATAGSADDQFRGGRLMDGSRTIATTRPGSNGKDLPNQPRHKTDLEQRHNLNGLWWHLDSAIGARGSMRTADDEFAHFAQDVTPGLRRLAIALCADPHRAEDLLQSTLEKMYPGWGRGRIENPAAYARRVLVRTLAAEQRRGWWKRERPTDELPWVVADDAHRKTDLRIVLYQALRALPPRQRQAVVLRFLEDLPIDTVADLLGCSPGTVKRSAHDGLRRLRALLPHLAERTTS